MTILGEGRYRYRLACADGGHTVRVSGKKVGAEAVRDLVTLQKLCPSPEGS